VDSLGKTVASCQWPVLCCAACRPVYQTDTSSAETVLAQTFAAPSWIG
jgi:hypothetical protein